MFRRKRKAAPPPLSPARAALLAADSALSEGRFRLEKPRPGSNVFKPL
jgi:hypothetical protein